MVTFVFKKMLWKLFFFYLFPFFFSPKSSVLTSVSPPWEQQARNAQTPVGHNPVGIKYRSLWNLSSQEQEELWWGAGVHMDLPALYAYAGPFLQIFKLLLILFPLDGNLHLSSSAGPLPKVLQRREVICPWVIRADTTYTRNSQCINNVLAN